MVLAWAGDFGHDWEPFAVAETISRLKSVSSEAEPEFVAGRTARHGRKEAGNRSAGNLSLNSPIS